MLYNKLCYYYYYVKTLLYYVIIKTIFIYISIKKSFQMLNIIQNSFFSKYNYNNNKYHMSLNGIITPNTSNTTNIM